MRIAASSGMPRKTATLLAAVEYSKVMVSPLTTSMKKTPMGGEKDNLEEGINGDENGAIFAVTTCEANPG